MLTADTGSCTVHNVFGAQFLPKNRFTLPVASVTALDTFCLAAETAVVASASAPCTIFPAPSTPPLLLATGGAPCTLLLDARLGGATGLAGGAWVCVTGWAATVTTVGFTVDGGAPTGTDADAAGGMEIRAGAAAGGVCGRRCSCGLHDGRVSDGMQHIMHGQATTHMALPPEYTVMLVGLALTMVGCLACRKANNTFGWRSTLLDTSTNAHSTTWRLLVCMLRFPRG